MVALLLRSALSLTRGKNVGYYGSSQTCWLAATPSSLTTATSTRVRYFSVKVSKYAEDLHIGRALSKTWDDLDAKKRRIWKKKVKYDQDIWKELEPPQNRYAHQYEMNALQDIHALSFNCNLLLEIRDVRLPASTHHPSFTRLARHRKHLICYTHADMINGATRDRVQEWTENAWPEAECRFVDTRQERNDSAEAFEEMYHWILDNIEKKGGMNYALTVGVPNTGKSSVLTNLLRYAREKGHIKRKIKARPTQFSKKGKKVKQNLRKHGLPDVQDVPGKTRELTEYLLYEKDGKHRKFFLDVPGMTPPRFFFDERPEAWYGFGAANLLHKTKHDTNDPVLQRGWCEYLLYCLNRDERYEYVRQLNLQEPTKDIDLVLSKFANKRPTNNEDKLLLKRCETFLKLFQTGNFGPVILDDISKPYKPFQFKNAYFRKEREQFKKERERRNKGGRDDDDDDDDDWDSDSDDDDEWND